VSEWLRACCGVFVLGLFLSYEQGSCLHWHNPLSTKPVIPSRPRRILQYISCRAAPDTRSFHFPLSTTQRSPSRGTAPYR
jgi:hypothetical protein